MNDLPAMIGRRPHNINDLPHAHADLQLESTARRREAGDFTVKIVDPLSRN
jgi:hypothetical protein